MISFSTEKGAIRKFGAVAFLFFGFLCAAGVWRGKQLLPYFFGTLSLLGMGFVLFPGTLAPLYKTWLRLSMAIGRAVTITTMSLLYYFVITPAGWIKFIISGRPLPLFPNKKCSSYWVRRNEPAQQKERFLKRY